MNSSQDCDTTCNDEQEKESQADVCAICCEDLSAEVTSSLECGHKFHTRCVLVHLQRLGSFCPLCRNDPCQRHRLGEVLEVESSESSNDDSDADSDGEESLVDDADVFQELINDSAIGEQLRQRPEYRHHFRTLDRWSAVSAHSRRTLRGVTSTLRHGEDGIHREIHRYRNARLRAFQYENRVMYDSVRRCESTINRAEAICRRTRHVMFLKVFGRSPRRPGM